MQFQLDSTAKRFSMRSVFVLITCHLLLLLLLIVWLLPSCHLSSAYPSGPTILQHLLALCCRWHCWKGAESFAVQINCSWIWLIHIIHANWQSFTLPFSLIRAIRNAKSINNTRMGQSVTILYLWLLLIFVNSINIQSHVTRAHAPLRNSAHANQINQSIYDTAKTILIA